MIRARLEKGSFFTPKMGPQRSILTSKWSFFAPYAITLTCKKWHFYFFYKNFFKKSQKSDIFSTFFDFLTKIRPLFGPQIPASLFDELGKLAKAKRPKTDLKNRPKNDKKQQKMPIFGFLGRKSEPSIYIKRVN